jgi:antitoxin component YwqK of YwqJK toxin-antitoxin module
MKNVVLFFLVAISFELSAQRELKTFFDNGTTKSSYKYTDLNNYDVSNFYITGKLMETGSFVNGKMNGLWTSYSENGVKSGEAFYLNGIKSGEWKIYDEVGSLKYKITYADNHIVSALNFDTAGKTVAETKTNK